MKIVKREYIFMYVLLVGEILQRLIIDKADLESRNVNILTLSDTYKTDQLSRTVAVDQSWTVSVRKEPIMGSLPRNSLAWNLTVASKKSYH